MADNIDIEPEFEDEDDFVNRLNNKEDSIADSPRKPQTDNTDTIEPDVPVQPNAPAFSPTQKKNKAAQREVQKAVQYSSRIQREQAAAERKRVDEEKSANLRRMKEEAKLRDSLAREQLANIRSQATNDRVQAYSLAASIGLQGYIASSIADHFFIRPQEEKAAAEQKEYQRQLRAYQAGMQEDEIQRAKQAREAIKARPIQATVIGPGGKPTYTTSTGIGGGSGAPPVPPPGTPPPTNPPGTPPPGQGPPGGSNPPPGPIPPRVPPTPPPNPSGGGMGWGASAISAITIAIQVANRINEAFDKVIDQAKNTAIAAISGDGTTATKGLIKAYSRVPDPLGVNIPINVAVESFGALLDINKSILEATKANQGFMPQTLQADVEGQIAKLFQQIELSRRLDKVVSELTRANTQFDMAWEEFKAEIIQNLGPAIVAALKVITWHVKAGTNALDLVGDILPILANSGNLLPFMVQQILDWLYGSNPQDVDKDLADQLTRFFDPSRKEAELKSRGVLPPV